MAVGKRVRLLLVNPRFPESFWSFRWALENILCEFCDIIVMFCRRPRTKRPEQIARELDALRTACIRSVFFVEDNLIGSRKAAKELLIFLADYRRRHNYPFRFGTEASLNLAGDEELLCLFREARFSWSAAPQGWARIRWVTSLPSSIVRSVITTS